MRVYISNLGLWLTLDSGKFEAIEIKNGPGNTGTVRIGLAPATEFTRSARLRVETPSRPGVRVAYHPSTPLRSERGAYIVPLDKETTWITLTAKQ